MKRLRRTLLEIWAIVPLAALVGFLGPFGTYLEADYPGRFVSWWSLLMGAYILVRPTMVFWNWIARMTALPRGSVVICGVIISSFPMAGIWQSAHREEIKHLGGYPGYLPFALVCSLAILLIAWWAERADIHLLRYYDESRTRWLLDEAGLELARPATGAPASSAVPIAAPVPVDAPTPHVGQRPRLYARLGRQFEGDILALESEDHYVRVHGPKGSELVLIRLRDAIAEMDGTPGEQTHRSWWVARSAVAGVDGTGRNREIKLSNGTSVPVARDSVDRLERSGLLAR